MKVNLGFHLEIKVPKAWRKSGEAQNPCCLKSSVKFPQSVMIWAAMSSAGVGPLCFLKSTVNAALYQEILEQFMLPSADKLHGDADFILQQDLAPAHTAKGTKSWFNDHSVTVLDWPANSPDLNPIEYCHDLKVTIKATWASIPPQQCHKLITSIYIYIYPPETQLWSFCLCSGHSILVNFSESSHHRCKSRCPVQSTSWAL